MDLESIRQYALQKPEVTESFPFGESTLVFKVLGKMFLLMSLEGDFTICAKCDPEQAIILREQFPFVQPGYHMNKQYWNTIAIDSPINDFQIRSWIDHSYEEVVKKLPQKSQQFIKGKI